MIGILAGMGPKSTGPFVDTVVAGCQTIYGAKHDMDFPHMMIYSCPTPFYMDRPIDHEAMKKRLLKEHKTWKYWRKLYRYAVQYGASLFWRITAFSFYPDFKYSWRNVTSNSWNCKRVALLATEATVQAGIYQDGIAKRNIEYIHYEKWQTMINQIIMYIKSGEVEEARKLWSALVVQLKDEVDTAIIACTDLNVVAEWGFCWFFSMSCESGC